MPRPARNPLEKQIEAVRATLRRLDGELRGLVPALAKATNVGATTTTSAGSLRRKLRLTPERRRALQLHGQYLGRIRLLKPRQKIAVKKMKVAKGYRAAIALARKLAGS
jgi:hypothetical protein